MPNNINPNALTGIIFIVTVVWAGSFVADIFVGGYDPPSGLNEVMMLLAGFLFAGRQASIRQPPPPPPPTPVTPAPGHEEEEANDH